MKKKSTWKRVIIIGLTVVVIFLIAGFVLWNRYFGLLDSRKGNLVDEADLVSYDTVVDEVESEEAINPENNITDEQVKAIEDKLEENAAALLEDAGALDSDTVNILLVGIDSRANSFSGRSDSMILVTINKKTKKVLMTSILRDIYLSIPGCMDNRINAAFVYGGSDLLIETLKTNFGMEVDNCVVVNFHIVMDLVDYFGGIDLDLTSDEIGVMNMYISELNNLLGHSQSADKLDSSLGGTTVHLNGKQALAYARVRYVGTDFARTGRQRTVIMKCLEKMKSMSLSDMDDFAQTFLPKVRTDLSGTDCASLLLLALSLSDYEFEQFTIPMEGTWSNVNIRGMAVLDIDFEKNIKAWREKVQGQTE